MGAFFDRLTAFGQPLTIAAVLMRIGVAGGIGAGVGLERENKNRPAGKRPPLVGGGRAGLGLPI